VTQRGLFASREPRRLPLTADECPLETPERPCPFVSCRHHLLIDQDARWVGNGMADGYAVNPIAIEAVGRADPDTWDDDEVERAIDALKETCSLDVAIEGAREQTEVAKLMGLGRTLVEKIEHVAITKLRDKSREKHAPVGTGRDEPRGRKTGANRVVSGSREGAVSGQCDLWGGVVGSGQSK
jgi:hypothetical protein